MEDVRGYVIEKSKQLFCEAYESSGLSKKNLDNMLYFMNILAVFKYYPENTTSKKLYEMILAGEY